MPQQIPLDLERPGRFGRETFVTDEALDAVLALLDQPETWLTPHLILMGPKGAGKTHLAHIFAATHNARLLTPAQTLDLGPLDGAYIVDDADQASEEALFHLSNHANITGQPLVLTTKTQPVAWRTDIPDLASRLRAMRLVVLPEPDEALLATVLKNLFARRAISPADDTLAYLAARMERSVPAAQKIVTELEYYANGRAFNKALIRGFMEQNETLFDDPDA